MNTIMTALLTALLWGGSPAEKVSSPEFKPVLLSTQTFQYPEIAKEMHIKGSVKVKLEIGANGKVLDYKILSSDHQVLTNEVVKKVKKLIFEPACDHDNPVISDTVLTFSFGQ